MERHKPIETEHSPQYNDDYAYSSLPFPDDLEAVRVAEGAFTMGSPASEVDFLLQYYKGIARELFVNEIGIHTVTLSTFHIDKFSVSNMQFRHFIEAGGYERQEWWSEVGWLWRVKTGRTAPRFWERIGPAQDEHPVAGITWYEADAYARSIGKRLPTEAEWEKAARGVDARRYPWGNSFELNHCNTADLWLDREIRDYHDWYLNFFLCRPWREHTITAPIHAFPQGASPYGVLNMGGNVWEWCADWYGEDYYTELSGRDPKGPAKETEKVCRGGSFGYFGWSARTTDRGHHPPHYYSLGLGMRCASND